MDSYFQNMTRDLGMQKDSGNRQYQCRWNCQIVESDLVFMIQATVVTKRRKLLLAFHYEKTVEDDCVNRISRNSNAGNLTEYWQLWFVNNTLPSFGGKVIRSFLTLIQASFEDQVKALCHFRNSNSSGKGILYGELSHPSEHLEKILHTTIRSLGEVCDAQSENDVQTCIQIRRFNRSARWKDFALHGLIVAFVIAFTYIGPAVVCLYPATERAQGGICQINVESPVGFRSLIGNYFFSAEYTTWHRARKLIMHVVLLPIPFLAPAIFVEYLLYQNLFPDQNILGGGLIFRPFRILCYGCYFCNAFYFHIIRVIPPDEERSCMYNISSWHGFQMGICFHRELPQRMLGHFRLFGSCISADGGFILAEFTSFVKDTWRNHSSTPIRRITVALLFAAISPLIAFIILVYAFLFFSLFTLISFPIVVLCSTTDLVSLWHLLNIYFLHRYPNLLFTVRVVAVLLDITLSWFASLGAMFVLRSAAVGALIFLQLAVAFALSEDNLPFLACCVSVSYYLWNSYSRSFICKYQDLAVNLYEYCDRLRPGDYHTTDNVKRIPKELFDMACEELMPIRKSICIFIVKISLSAIFIFLVFSFTTSMNTSSMMKCLVAFLAGTFPTIVNIYLDSRKQNGNFEQRTLKIIQEYINSTRQRDYICYPGDAYSEKDTFFVGMGVGMVPTFISWLCCLFFLHTWWGSRLVVVHSTL